MGNDLREEASFNPEENLKKVRDISDIEDYKNLTQEEKVLIKKEKIAKFKKELSDFLIAIGEINKGLEKIILSNSFIDKKKLEEYLKEQAEKYKLNDIIINFYKEFINKVEERSNVIDYYYERYKEKGGEFFKYFFNKEPKNEVEIKKKSICLELFCSNNDFNKIKSSEPFKGMIIAKDEKNELNDAVILFNREYVNEKEEIDKIITHEEKHAMDFLLESHFKQINQFKITQIQALKEYLSNLKDRNSRKKSIEKILDEYEKLALFRIRAEIFARLKAECGQFNVKDFVDFFVNDKKSPYNFFRLNDISFPISMIRFFDRKLFNEITLEKEKKFKQVIEQAVDIISILRFAKISEEDIVGILQNDPLDRWQKIFKRIKSADKIKKNLTMFKSLGNNVSK